MTTAESFFFTEERPENIVWYEMIDAQSNHPYWLHASTGVSQWEPPEWLDQLDPESGCVYYVHNATGESTWDRPEGFEVIARQHRHTFGFGGDDDQSQGADGNDSGCESESNSAPGRPNRPIPPLPLDAQTKLLAASEAHAGGSGSDASSGNDVGCGKAAPAGQLDVDAMPVGALGAVRAKRHVNEHL